MTSNERRVPRARDQPAGPAVSCAWRAGAEVKQVAPG